MQRRYRTQYGKDPPSDNAIRRWVKQLQETGSVLHRKEAGRPSTSQEDVDRIQETLTSYVARKACILKLFSILQYFLQIIALFELYFIFCKQFYVVLSSLKIIGHRRHPTIISNHPIYWCVRVCARYSVCVSQFWYGLPGWFLWCILCVVRYRLPTITLLASVVQEEYYMID
jgi:hypothetical protein